jgi:hypothetical protein
MKSTLRALNKNGCTITFERVCLPISGLFAICIDYIFVELIKLYLIAFFVYFSGLFNQSLLFSKITISFKFFFLIRLMIRIKFLFNLIKCTICVYQYVKNVATENDTVYVIEDYSQLNEFVFSI